MHLILHRLRWLLLLQALPFCSGQQVTVPRRTVTGTVVNGISGEPIRRALVRLSGSFLANVLTGADGRFEIADVPEGQFVISPQKPGFFDSDSAAGDWPRPPVSFTVGSGKNDFRLTLFPAARISGRVLDSDGEGVDNTQLQVLYEQITQGRKQWQPRSTANTDDDGMYHMDELAPGRYIAFVNGRAAPSQSWNSPRETIPPTYYPDAHDTVSAQQIELRPGQEFHADFNVRPARAFRVAGRVGGIPSTSGAAISFETSNGQTIWFDGMNFDPSRGQFAAEAVPAGTWTVVAWANDSQGHSYNARQEIAVSDADVTNVQLLLHPAASIPITVNHAANAAEPVLTSQPVNPGLNATLISTEGLNLMYGAQMRGAPPALVFTDVIPGRYRFDVQTYGSECLESARYGDVDLLRDSLVVGPEGATQPLSINLRSDCSTLSVKLPSSEKETSGFLLVVPSSSTTEPKIVQIGTANSASLMLSPGSYQVFAFDNLEGLEYANPEALRQYSGQSISVDPGQKLELTVELTERRKN